MFGKILGIIALCVYSALSTSPASAQSEFPNKPIKLIVPFPPGASTDSVARLLAQAAEAELKVPIVVDNVPGANGNIGAQRVAKAAADGYTLLYNTSSLVLSPALYAKPGYDPIADFAPIVGTVTIPLVYVVSNDLPVRNVKEFVAYAKQNPGKIAYGSAGLGNGTHLGAQSFFDVNELQTVHVPYKGGTQALVDLAGGRVQFYAGSFVAMSAFIKEKRVRPIAVASRKRLPALPEVPTVDEALNPNFEAGLWQGIVAPAGTPRDVVANLNLAFQRALKDPAVMNRLEQEGAFIVSSSPDQYGEYLKSELVRWGKVVRAAGIKPQ